MSLAGLNRSVVQRRYRKNEPEHRDKAVVTWMENATAPRCWICTGAVAPGARSNPGGKRARPMNEIRVRVVGSRCATARRGRATAARAASGRVFFGSVERPVDGLRIGGWPSPGTRSPSWSS